MKRRKLACCLCLGALFCILDLSNSAIAPPPWSDPAKNPCALMPGGWQLIYWPPLKTCFKIFSTGFPCPETMELAAMAVPAKKGSLSSHANNAFIAECRCPPGTAMSILTSKCHKLFTRGPCEHGQYFSPLPPKRHHDTRTNANRSSIHWGVCKTPALCEEDGHLFWPDDEKCYAQFSKGPCFKGKLLILNEDGLAECKCENKGALKRFFYEESESCHEFYTKGPCSTPGHIFLPGGRCDCHRQLPNYYEPHQMCYELDTVGPCAAGHVFSLMQNSQRNATECRCKIGFVPWSDGQCYRLYTRGPCASNEFLINATSCAPMCVKNKLYFPEQNACYRIGSQGPCPLHQVVVFDFNARPSVDGIPYNGVCGCSGILKDLGLKCDPSADELKSLQMMYKMLEPNTTMKTLIARQNCEDLPGRVLYKGACHLLYNNGPCAHGQWLAPVRPRTVQEYRTADKAKCVCRPGYTPAQQFLSKRNENSVDATGNGIIQPCNAPVVGLARYLNHFQSLHAEEHSATNLTFALASGER